MSGKKELSAGGRATYTDMREAVETIQATLVRNILALVQSYGTAKREYGGALTIDLTDVCRDGVSVVLNCCQRFYINKVVCCGELLYFIEVPSGKAIYHDEVRDLFALVEVYGKLLIYAKNRERKERK